MNDFESFIDTQQYQLFSEFCDSCIRYQYIGLCYGSPGVGKTKSAKHYSKWDRLSQAKFTQSETQYFDYLEANKALNIDTVFYTPSVAMNAKTVYREIEQIREQIKLSSREMVSFNKKRNKLIAKAEIKREKEKQEFLASMSKHEKKNAMPASCYDYESSPTLFEVKAEGMNLRKKISDPTKLIIIDEAERLSAASLDQVRYMYDEGGIGLVLIGMPGIEKQMARYPQLSSRVGFVHKFDPLKADQIRSIWKDLFKQHHIKIGKNFIEKDAMTAIIRSTRGNFRLLERLLTQIARILEINELDKITEEVVEVAAENLVIGSI